MPAAGHGDPHGPAWPQWTWPPCSHPAAGFKCFGRGSPPRWARSHRLCPVASSVGSAARAGLFIVGSHGAGRGAACARAGTRTGTCMGSLCTFWGGWGVFIYLLVCSALL